MRRAPDGIERRRHHEGHALLGTPVPMRLDILRPTYRPEAAAVSPRHFLYGKMNSLTSGLMATMPGRV